MSKIRQSAKGETCTFQIPGVCNHNPETVVLCHAPHPDKGTGKKGPDSWGAYGCCACHDEVDGRTRHIQGPYLFGQEMTRRNAVTLFWFTAIRETQRRLIAKGLLPK